MIDATINDGKTIAGGGKEVTLAGRYHIFRQLGQGGMGAITVRRQDMIQCVAMKEWG